MNTCCGKNAQFLMEMLAMKYVPPHPPHMHTSTYTKIKYVDKYLTVEIKGRNVYKYQRNTKTLRRQFANLNAIRNIWIQPKMNGDISVQTIYNGNKNVRKIWVVFIVYGREVNQHTAFRYLNLQGKEHLGQLDVIDWLRVRRFGVRTPVAETFFPPV